jgi:hypothetical protein
MERLRREQLRADISPEEAAEECAEIEARAAWMEGADLDDDLLGDPDEYDFDEDDRDDGLQFCSCSVNHGIEELDWNQCDCCGKEIE